MNYAPKKPHFCEEFEKAALFSKYLAFHDTINEKLFSSNIFEYFTLVYFIIVFHNDSNPMESLLFNKLTNIFAGFFALDQTLVIQTVQD